MSEWTTIRLGSVVRTNTTSYSPKEGWKYVNYLDTGNITENVIDAIQNIDLANEKLPSRAKRKVQINSILYSTVRPNQKHFGIIKSMPENFLVSTGFAVIDIIPDKIDADYLYFWLTQNTVVEQLHAIAEQSVSAYPSIKASDIENLEITLPPLTVQKSIASILKSISDKMSHNSNINENLEQQMKAIFNKFISERSVTSKTTVENVVLTANTGADAIQKAPIVDYDTGIRCVRVGDMTNNRSFHDWGYTKVTEEVFNRYQLHKNDIIVTRTASLGLNTIISEDLQAVYNNGLIRLSINDKKALPLFIYRQFQTDDFSNYIARIESETSVRPNMKINYLLKYEFELPSLDEQNELINLFQPMNEQQSLLINENKMLESLRDTLLPRLMSGELDVSDIDL